MVACQASVIIVNISICEDWLILINCFVGFSQVSVSMYKKYTTINYVV